MAASTVAWTHFHHPQWNATVIRRRVGDELMGLLYLYGDVIVSGYGTLLRSQMGRTREAERQAVRRLCKRGLVINRRGLEGVPTLAVSPRWNPPDVLRPERLWACKWAGIWFMLIYDIAEADRSRRDTIRIWLKRLRLGCLQKSVWITPWDIRADFADLTRVTGLSLSCCLLESRVALGHTDADLVRQAWDWNSLEQQHQWYLSAAQKLLASVSSRKMSPDKIIELVREEMAAYLAAMEGDPLLPSELHPESYRGREVAVLHNEWVRATRLGFGL